MKLQLLAMLTCVLMCQAVAAKKPDPGQPNIVFIIADDCTFRDIGCYGSQAHTPNIDRLASEGMKFSRCFQAAPMCSPTRHNIYTGQYPVKSGAYPNHTRVDEGTKSIVQYLEPLGYEVVHTGKSHVNPSSVFSWKHFGKDKSIDFESLDGFMKQSTTDSNPFCLLLCSNEPHTPWNKGDASKYPVDKIKLPPYLLDTPETREGMSRYLAEITYFDGQVGQALDLIEKHRVADNTLVMVVSEQGNSLPFAKWTCYDNGLQSACIVRWPGKVAAGSVNAAMIEYVDFLPTFVEAAGGTPGEALDGRSLLDVFAGKQEHKQHVFGEMTTRGISNGSEHYGIRSVRSEQYKYIWNFTPEMKFENACTKSNEFTSWVRAADSGDERAKELVRRYHHRPEIELYDVSADPLEMHNLAGDRQYANVKQQLRRELEACMKRCGDEGQATELKAMERQGSRRQSKKKRGGTKNGKGKPDGSVPKTLSLLKAHVGDGEVSAWETFGGDWSEDEGVLSVSGSPAKALLADVRRRDFELTVELRAKQKSQAGVIFRVTDAASGLDSYQGYYIGVHAGRDTLMWGASDGGWKSIASRSAPVVANAWHQLRLVVQGARIRAWINQTPVADGRFPKFDGVDYRFGSGGIGLRALGAGAEFRNLEIRKAPAKPKVATYTNPVQAACADPGVILHEGTYYAFCTYTPDFPKMPRGIRLYTSKNLADWKDRGFAITADQSWGDSRFWAPDIIEKDGDFYLYYAADTRICVAKASYPGGPFTQIGGSPMEPDSIRIDAHVFKDDDGKCYFYYVKFNRGNEIWGGELNEDMVTVKRDSLRLMVKPDQAWEQHKGRVVEGPEILKHKGVYYLTYSGSHFESPHYAVGYATSNNPLGPWKKYAYNPVMKSTAYAHGTAHHDFTTSPDGTERFIVYHRHFSLAKTEPRRMAVDRVQFVEQPEGPDISEIHGPTASPQPLPSGSPATAPKEKQPNVVLLFIDDLKPMTRDYGHAHMHTPNFDRLANQGMRFENAYCQVPTCGASRASLMTSLYPTVARFPDFKCWAEKDASGAPTLPQRFREAGYITISNGKVFHHPDDTADRSWSAPPWRPPLDGKTPYNDETYKFLETSEHTKKNGAGKTIKKPLMFEKGRVDPLETHDGLITAKTLDDLDRFADADRPFFIACGLAKPHMPFYSPASTWKPYPLKSISLAKHRRRPNGMPLAAREIHEQFAYVPMSHDLSREIKYNGDLYHRRMRQGYYASVTHADNLLGRILDKLDSLGIADNTYVVVLGDHGWLLGEHNEWAKNTLLHEALRTAMWMKGPGISPNAAAETFVEFVDIYPTLCELTGIQLDASTIDGKSFAAVLKSPQATHRQHAYSRFETGDSITSTDFQYGSWTSDDGAHEALLIDRRADPLGKKSVNGDPAYADAEAKLLGILQQRIDKANRHSIP